MYCDQVAPPRASQGPASLLDTKFNVFWPGKGSFVPYWPLKPPETVRFGTAWWDGATGAFLSVTQDHADRFGSR